MIVLAVTLSLTECLVIGGIGLFFFLGPWAASKEAIRRVKEKDCYTHFNNDSRKEMEAVCKLVKELDEFQFVSSTEDEWLYKCTYKFALKGKLPHIAALFRAAHIAGVNISVRLKSNRSKEEEANGNDCISSFISYMSPKDKEWERRSADESKKREKIQSHGYYK